MKTTVYTKPLRMPDDFPTRISDTIKVTEDNGKVTKIEKLVGSNYQDITPENKSTSNNYINGEWLTKYNTPWCYSRENGKAAKIIGTFLVDAPEFTEKLLEIYQRDGFKTAKSYAAGVQIILANNNKLASSKEYLTNHLDNIESYVNYVDDITLLGVKSFFGDIKTRSASNTDIVAGMFVVLKYLKEEKGITLNEEQLQFDPDFGYILCSAISGNDLLQMMKNLGFENEINTSSANYILDSTSLYAIPLAKNYIEGTYYLILQLDSDGDPSQIVSSDTAYNEGYLDGLSSADGDYTQSPYDPDCETGLYASYCDGFYAGWSENPNNPGLLS